MTLPRTEPRCRGRRTDADECTSCARRAAAEAERNAWPFGINWIVPPIARPCAWRIELNEETTT